MSEKKYSERTWETFDQLIDQMIENDQKSEAVMSVKRMEREEYLKRIEGRDPVEDYKCSMGPWEGEYEISCTDARNIDRLACEISVGRVDVVKQLRIWKSLFRPPKYLAMTKRLDEVLYGPFLPGDTRERLTDLDIKRVGD